MTPQHEIHEKEARLRELLKLNDLEAVLLKRQANFSWLTGGGLNVFRIATELGASSLLITPEEKFVISDNIEAPRMVKEERLEEQGFRVKTFDWYDYQEAEVINDLIEGQKLGSDVPFPGAVDMAGDIARLRYSLTPTEVERYQWLGDKVSLALEKTLTDVRKREKESEVVGRLCRELWKYRIDPIVLMAAADERAFEFRHPIPSEKRIDRYLMVSAAARKWGLTVSLTRSVYLGLAPDDLRAKYEASVYIDCRLMKATRPGRPAREALERGIDAYREKGYPEEWKLHHQGGAIGYDGRDYQTDLKNTDVIMENQAFAWCPTISGAKSEDTILAAARGPAPLTRPTIFPVLKVELDGSAFERPDILEK